jgi:hypothetical protein
MWEDFSNRCSESASVGRIKPLKYSAAHQPTGAEESLVDVIRSAIDGADNLETKEIGKHPIREIQDRAHLCAIISCTGHQGGIRILKDYSQLVVGMDLPLFCPEPDEIRLR